jgi:hypothetical protein
MRARLSIEYPSGMARRCDELSRASDEVRVPDKREHGRLHCPLLGAFGGGQL